MLTIKLLTKIEIWDSASIFCRRWIFGAKELPLKGNVLHPFLCWRWTKWIPWFAPLRTQFREFFCRLLKVCEHVREEPVAPASKDDDLVAIIALLQHNLLPVWGFQLQTSGTVRTACLMEKTKVLSSRNIWISLSLCSCSYYSCSYSGCFRAMGCWFCAADPVCGSHPWG